MPFGKRIDGPTGRRRIEREEVVLAACAQTLKASRDVVVSDVSPKGAKLQGRQLNTLDRDVLLLVGAIDLFAKIAWATPGECGIIFEEPLSSDMVDHIKSEGRWAKVMGLAA
jgi:hypothetical protein